MLLLTQENKKYVHTTVLPIRWGDMDAMGHVNHTEYFRYMEQSRVEWLHTLGYAVELSYEEGPVIANVNCTFKAPLIYPGTIELRMYIGKVGRSSFTTWHEIRMLGQDAVYAEGLATVVWISTATAKSTPLPSNLRTHLETA